MFAVWCSLYTVMKYTVQCASLTKLFRAPGPHAVVEHDKRNLDHGVLRKQDI